MDFTKAGRCNRWRNIIYAVGVLLASRVRHRADKKPALSTHGVVVTSVTASHWSPVRIRMGARKIIPDVVYWLHSSL